MKIWYSNPYSIEKNFGRAINEFCEIVPDDNDWIVIQDGDMLYLKPDWGKVVHDNLVKYGSDYQLFGCKTNRIGLKDLLLNGEFSDDFDVKKHYDLACGVVGSGVSQTDYVAGFFMAFQKKTWDMVDGFIENSYNFDSNFSLKIRDIGGKIAIINELYVFHQYRIWSKDPRAENKHLK